MTADRNKKAARSQRGQSFYLLFGSFLIIILICFALVVALAVNNAARAMNVAKGVYHDAAYATIDSVSKMPEDFNAFGDFLASFADSTNFSDTSALSLSEVAAMNRTDLEKADLTGLMLNLFSLYSSSNNIPGAIVYLYFSRSHYALRIGGAGDAIASGEISNILGITDEDWDLLTSAGEEPVCIIEQTENMNFPRLMLGRTIMDGVVMIDAIPSETITDQMNDHYLPEESDVILLSTNGQFLLSASRLPDGVEIAYDDFSGTGGELNITSTASGHQKYFVYYSQLSGTSLKMAVIIRDTLTSVYRSSILRTIVMALILWVGLGSALSWLIARRIYRPVSVLMARLPENLDAPDNDFQKLQYFVDSLVNRNVSYEETLRKQRYLLSSSLFLRLLGGTIGWTEDVTKYMEQSDFPVHAQQYLLFELILIADENSLIPENSPDTPFALYAQFKEVLAKQKFDSFIVHVEDKFVGLADLTDQDHQPDFDAFHEVQTNLGLIRCRVAVSDSFSSLEDISQAYTQLATVRDTLLLSEQSEAGTTLFYKDIQEERARGTSVSGFLPALSRVTGRIAAADYDGAADALRDTFSVLISSGLSEKERRFRINYLLQTIYLAINSVPELDKAKVQELTKDYPGFHGESLARLQEKLEEIIRKLPQCRSHTDEESLLVARIREYVQKNCTDSLISAGAVAEQFHVSLPWLSVHFKEQSGTGFLDYLHQCRLNLAKQKLVQTDDSMQEIALACGYTSSATFSRTFRKYEGVTPTWYRQSHSGG